MNHLSCDIAVIGASLGGVRAAIAAAALGQTVILTEETDWIGGQLTAQGVPPDENPYIEEQGAPESYLLYRKKVRDHYRSLPSFKEEVKSRERFNPGDCWVTRIGHEPAVALQILTDELAPYIASGRVTLLLHTTAKDAWVEKDTIRTVTVVSSLDGQETEITASQFIDGTDCGDLLPLVGAEYRTGAESQAETGEPDAPELPNREDMQPVTWVFALEMVDALAPEDRMEKPAAYDRYANTKAFFADVPVFGWTCMDIRNDTTRVLRMFSGDNGPGSLGLWEYRRVIGQSNYIEKVNEVSLINWPQQDYMFGNLFDNENAAYHREQAKEFSRCLAYWIQNDAPRVDGGFGYPVRFAKGVLGTEDGFAKAPYIRESRRIVAKYTIPEQNIELTRNPKVHEYADSVGVGQYCMDFHETIVTHVAFSADTQCFEIPLGALIPIRLRNLLPACKNLGTTHMTSSAYRLHPIEWNIGESAGYLAAMCVQKGLTPAQVYENPQYIEEYQTLLLQHGVQLHWKNLD